MSERNPRLQPHVAKVRSGAKDAWWYEDDRGIDIYVQPPPGVNVSVVRILWRNLELAMNRRNKTRPR